MDVFLVNIPMLRSKLYFAEEMEKRHGRARAYVLKRCRYNTTSVVCQGNSQVVHTDFMLTIVHFIFLNKLKLSIFIHNVENEFGDCKW